MAQTLQSQLGSQSIGYPPLHDEAPSAAPGLYHLKNGSVEQNGDVRHTITTQVGKGAVAPPADNDSYTNGETQPPGLYHINGDAKHTSTTQVGPTAVAPPVEHTEDSAAHRAAPELHHLNNGNHTSATQVGASAVAPPADKTADDPGDLLFHDLPPFPDDVPTVPLLRISLRKLLDGDADEIDNVWKACREIGFFYLDLRSSSGGTSSKRDSGHDQASSSPSASAEIEAGDINGEALLKDVDALFSLGEHFFALPVSEKQKYDFAAKGSYFGYKGFGAGISDKQGTPDRNEFYNTSKDDILQLPGAEPVPKPSLLQQEDSRALFERYMRRSHAIILLILSQLNAKLGLPHNTLGGKHRLEARSGDQVRWVRSPPQPTNDRKRALGEHTDFGSVTVLFNRLGGLQVLPPGDDNDTQWSYVKPLKGHCIINLGDAMVKFTAGVLRSNIHRVVNPPGQQADSTRISLVYFSRPEDDVMLKVLDDDGDDGMIAARRAEYEAKHGTEEVSAKEWTLRRALGRRGIGAYTDGTEDRKLD